MRKLLFKAVLVLIPCALILASCETSREAAIRTELAKVPTEIKQSCTGAQYIADDVSIGQAIEAGTLDGANLDQCQDKHLALVSVVDTIVEIQGAKP